MLFDEQKPDRMLHRVRPFTPLDPDGFALVIEYRRIRQVQAARRSRIRPVLLPRVPWYTRALFWLVNLFD